MLEASIKKQTIGEPFPPPPYLLKSYRALKVPRKKLSEGSFEMEDSKCSWKDGFEPHKGTLRIKQVEFALLNSLVRLVEWQEI